MSIEQQDEMCGLCHRMLQACEETRQVLHNGKRLSVCKKCAAYFCAICNAQNVSYHIVSLDTGESIHVCNTCVQIRCKKGSRWIMVGEVKKTPFQGPWNLK